MKIAKDQYCLYTAFAGLIVAMVVGFAEAKLHYSSIGFGGEEYLFFTGVSDANLTMGHFIAAFCACFYLIGFAHIYSMIKDNCSGVEKSLTPMLFSYGMSVGAVWLGSRIYVAKVAKLAFTSETLEFKNVLNEFAFFNETLLWATRISVLAGSIFLIYLILSSKTNFPKYMAFFSPILVVIYCFLIFLVMPSVGQYLMPIAMNVAFFVFFGLSFLSLLKRRCT